jgi:hypothetical protein
MAQQRHGEGLNVIDVLGTFKSPLKKNPHVLGGEKYFN